jgi:hypothetical protein
LVETSFNFYLALGLAIYSIRTRLMKVFQQYGTTFLVGLASGLIGSFLAGVASTLVGVRISLGAWPWEKERLKERKERGGVEMGRWMRRGWVEEMEEEERGREERERSEATILRLGRRSSVGGVSLALGGAGLADTPTEGLRKVSGRGGRAGEDDAWAAGWDGTKLGFLFSVSFSSLPSLFLTRLTASTSPW